MLFSFLLTIKRDLVVTFRQKIQCLNPLVFFALVTLLFPLAVTSDPNKLMQMGPGVIWIALIFANMLMVENVFSEDYEDGSLEQMLLQSESLSILVLAKLIAHWIFLTIPLLLMSGIISQFFFIPWHAVIILFFSLLLGSPVLICLGAVGSALSLGLQNRGLILILMVLPLYLPILIFGAGAVNNACLNLPVAGQLSFLGALCTFSLTFAPLAVASALKITLE